MPPALTPPPPVARGGPPAPVSRVALDLAPRKAQEPVPRIVLYAPEKWGKTSFAAFAPDPVVFMARGETGYDTLLGSGTVPAVPAMVVDSWKQLLGWLDDLAANLQGRKTIVLDAIGGFERLCQEHVCAEEFDGDWSERGFMGFMRGYDRASGEWIQLLQRLDKLQAKGIVCVMLGHAKVKSFNDPMGPAYDRYICDCHDKVWQTTARWSDCILFGKFFTVVETSGAQKSKSIAERKGKGIGGTQRVVYSVGCDAFVAGNRYGMMPDLSVPDQASQTWGSVWGEITRQKGQVQ